MNNLYKKSLYFFILISLIFLCFLINKNTSITNTLSSYQELAKNNYNEKLNQLRADIDNLNLEQTEKQIKKSKKELLEIEQHMNKYEKMIKSFDNYSYLDKLKIKNINFNRIQIEPEECVQEAYFEYKNYLTTKKWRINKLIVRKNNNMNNASANSVDNKIKRYEYTIKYINFLKGELTFDREYYRDLSNLTDYCKIKIIELVENNRNKSKDRIKFNNRKHELSNLEKKLKNGYKLKDDEEKLRNISIGEYISLYFSKDTISLIHQLENKRSIIRISLGINIFVLVILLLLLVFIYKKR